MYSLRGINDVISFVGHFCQRLTPIYNIFTKSTSSTVIQRTMLYYHTISAEDVRGRPVNSINLDRVCKRASNRSTKYHTQVRTTNNIHLTCQFGAFLYGAWQLGACQFGASQYDAIPVRRVSIWRDASLTRVTPTRFSFLHHVDPVCNFVSASLARTTLARILWVSFLYVLYCLRRIFIDVIKVSSGVHYNEHGNIEGVFLWLAHTFIN